METAMGTFCGLRFDWCRRDWTEEVRALGEGTGSLERLYRAGHDERSAARL